ncbi:PREDICTED: progressive rod-cone degeneration protein-like [Pygoscelis adeliae]|nr:PREDICTED: progressive rod-cone degeneration protein-like [Pygoscelis adeliae]
MCTTVLLLGTLVMMLRRRFFNKVEPYVLSPSRPLGAPGLGTGG